LKVINGCVDTKFKFSYGINVPSQSSGMSMTLNISI